MRDPVSSLGYNDDRHGGRSCRVFKSWTSLAHSAFQGPPNYAINVLEQIGMISMRSRIWWQFGFCLSKGSNIKNASRDEYVKTGDESVETGEKVYETQRK